MSSQEMKKKDKGKEVVTFEENPSTSLQHLDDQFDHRTKVSMVLSEQEISALLESTTKETYVDNLEESKKVGVEEEKSSSSKITPCIFYTSDEKARLRWSSDLHDCFVHAVEKLGGPDKATPKSVKEMMEVEGIALHHVKSHLQKFRLGKCHIRDRTNQYIRRYRTARDVKKTCASLTSARPQVNIKPKVMGVVKPKPKREKEVQGSLYMLIENDLHLQRCHEAQRMQNAFAVENQHNMLETQYFSASMTPTIHSDQHNNYISTSTPISQQHMQEQWLIPFPYHFPEGETNSFTMNYSRQPSLIIPQSTTSVADFCNDSTLGCLSLSDFTQNMTSSTSSTQGNLQFNDNHNYNMGQGFINPYTTTEPQLMPGLSTITTQPPLHQLNNDDCVIHDSHCNATFLSTTGTLNNTNLFSTSPQAVPTYVPHHAYGSYPPYNTLEMVKAQLNALQNSSSSRTQETPSREANLSSSVTRDEVDPVDKYIDWDKVEEMDIEFDPDEVLMALGLE